MGAPTALFVGFTTYASRPALLTAPVAPSNYKKPEAIASYVEEHKIRWQDEMAETPPMASLKEVAIYDQRGELFFHKKVSATDTDIAKPFWEIMHTHWGHFCAEGVRHTLTAYATRSLSAVLVGMRVDLFARIAATDTIIRHGTRVHIPATVWVDGWGLLDPLKACFDAESRKRVTVSNLLGVMLGTPVMEDTLLFQNPAEQAKLAHQLAIRAQLLDRD